MSNITNTNITNTTITNDMSNTNTNITNTNDMSNITNYITTTITNTIHRHAQIAFPEHGGIDHRHSRT